VLAQGQGNRGRKRKHPFVEASRPGFKRAGDSFFELQASDGRAGNGTGGADATVGEDNEHAEDSGDAEGTDDAEGTKVTT
jgi:hypothetical protein